MAIHHVACHGLSRSVVNDAAAAVIELRDTSKSYGAVQALRDASLFLRPSEVRARDGRERRGQVDESRRSSAAYLSAPLRPACSSTAKPVDFHPSHESREDAGIAVIYQEPTLRPGPEHCGERG